MKRKNLVAMGLAGVMAVGMCMPVMAADGTVIGPDTLDGQSPTDKTPATDITAEVDVAYSLTIPSAVTYKTDGTDSTFSISVDQTADKFLLHENGKLNVTVSDATIKLTNELEANKAGTKEYPVQLETTQGVAVTANSPFATFENDSIDPVEVYVNKVKADQKFKAAGKYTGKATFNVSYDLTTPAQP